MSLPSSGEPLSGGAQDVLCDGEEIRLALVRDADAVRQDDAQGEAGQLLICGSAQHGPHNLLFRLFGVLVAVGEVSRDIVKDGLMFSLNWNSWMHIPTKVAAGAFVKHQPQTAFQDH